MDNIQILWVDDEIDLLKPHILFLKEKSYEVDIANNGYDALEMIEEKFYDLVFLDENMPGLNGLDTLSKIKEKHSNLPVVMITKSEEESIMEEAIGSQIADYLIKPVHPKQILLSLKKNLDKRRLVNETTTSKYQREFGKISMDLAQVNSHEDWMEFYKRLIYWELELDKLDDESLNEILITQKKEANAQFFKFISRNYESWFHGDDKPTLSHTLLKDYLNPLLGNEEKVFMLVVDNLRYDQWKVLQPIIESYYKLEEEKSYYSILPTATQYARNSLFAGLTPLDIQKKFSDKWVWDTEEEGKNLYEEDFLKDQLQRLGHKDMSMSYHKITNLNSGKKLVEKLTSLSSNQLNVVVYNFVDMLSHAKTDMKVIKELADNDKAYRSLTLSWFMNSPLLDMIKIMAEQKVKLIVTTDHGTINVEGPTKLVGDRSVNTNLRYKTGRNMTYQNKDVYEVKSPEDIYLPKTNINTSFVFAKEDLFFAYPNNYNHFVNYYRNTYQHGGVSLEEMIIPFIVLNPK